MLSENGYQATSMNDIAARAGVGKAAIYRRWSSKAALITDALVYWRPDLLSYEAPDTGSLAGDLDAIVQRAVRNDNDLVTNLGGNPLPVLPQMTRRVEATPILRRDPVNKVHRKRIQATGETGLANRRG